MTKTLSPSPALSHSRALPLATATAPSRNLRVPAHTNNRENVRSSVRVARTGRRSAAHVHSGRDSLGRYRDPAGRAREVIARRRRDGCLLVVDRDARTRGDGRLVAQLAAEEPAVNAALVSTLYLRDPQRGRCRRVTAEDLVGKVLPEEGEKSSRLVCDTQAPLRHGIAAGDVLYGLELMRTDFAARELRWCRRSCRTSSALAPGSGPMCLREVIGAVESYEPALEHTRRALAGYRRDANVSTTALRAELERLRDSPIVLNRELRRTVLAAVENRGLSLSEIAIRCGRIKRDSKGNTSGETSWLARRVGILPESGSGRRTPWIHSDVLALIARNGLGISPREVELG